MNQKEETREEKIQRYTEQIDRYEERIQKLRSAVSINKNLILYVQNYDLMIKTTDYKKGYWAETPIKLSEARELSRWLHTWVEGGSWAEHYEKLLAEICEKGDTK